MGKLECVVSCAFHRNYAARLRKKIIKPVVFMHYEAMSFLGV